MKSNKLLPTIRWILDFSKLKTELCFAIVYIFTVFGCSPNGPDKTTDAVYIYSDKVRQVIRGFGAANILPWRPDMTADEVDKAFGTGDGQIGFSLLRLRIPSSKDEFSLNLPTGKEILDCMNAGMSAYIWWYMVRFYGPIYDDGSHPDTPPGAVPGEISKRGYVMSQFARFVRPGYFRIDATENPKPGVFITAYRDNFKIVIVVVNTGTSSAEQTFVLENGTAATFTPYVTSGTKNCNRESDIAVSNGRFTVRLDGSSISTFVSD